jgi:predicted DNA-binding protein YlxM (UPF0122 family)
MDLNETKAQALASKLDKLNEHFDIVDSTLNECTEYVDSLSIDPLDSDIVLREDVFITSDDMLIMLRTDFMSARSTLIDNLENGRNVLNAVNSKLTMFDDDIANAELVSAFATLMKTINDSTKLLIGLYKDIVQTHKLLKTEPKDSKDVNITGDVTINTISGNISDIIKNIRANNV